jgi:hypothetical protein
MTITRETKRRGDIEWHAYHCDEHGAEGFPGCTTMIGKKDKGFPFQTWLKRQGALAALKNMEALHAMVETSGEEATTKFLAAAADKLRDDAGDRGTRIHDCADKMWQREPFKPEPDIFVDVEHLRDWANGRKPKVLASEFAVISETHRYGATGDLLIETDLREWGKPKERATILIDVKTSKAAYAETALQLAAIRWADHSEAPIEKATHFGVLHVRPERTVLIPYDVTARDFDAFLACADLYYWDKTRAKEVKA